MIERCTRCGQPRIVREVTVCGASVSMTRPCDACAPIIALEAKQRREADAIQRALSDCGIQPVTVPIGLQATLQDVIMHTSEPGGHVVLVGEAESGKTVTAQAWVVEMARQGHRALYLTGDDATAKGADELVAEWAMNDAVVVDGLGQDWTRLGDWQSSRIARLASAMKGGRLLITTPWAKRCIALDGRNVNGWGHGLGAPLSARLAIRGHQIMLPGRLA